MRGFCNSFRRGSFVDRSGSTDFSEVLGSGSLRPIDRYFLSVDSRVNRSKERETCRGSHNSFNWSSSTPLGTQQQAQHLQELSNNSGNSKNNHSGNRSKSRIGPVVGKAPMRGRRRGKGHLSTVQGHLSTDESYLSTATDFSEVPGSGSLRPIDKYFLSVESLWFHFQK
ncbi:hypothetical protein Taro_020014, partial [Colocasia esculenta]|nr:hypothetical protein [Colocasia esculenta]